MSNIIQEDKLAQLYKVIDQNKYIKGSLMLILHKAQGIFGCVPLKVQQEISNRLNIPLAEIYGVVTFYSHFTLEPRGKFTIGVCLGTACYVKGAGGILNKVKEELNIEVGKTTDDRKFTLEATRCIGACGLAPVMTINEDVYGNIKEIDIPSILKKY